MAGYRELKVWRLAMELAEEVYKLCAEFPQARGLWINQPVTTCGSFHSFQHSGGTGAQFKQGVFSFSGYCAGFIG